MRASVHLLFAALASGGSPPPPPPSSAWNPSDKDADVSLSSSDTVASVTAALGSPRGAQGRDASDDRYFEITIGGDDANQLVGIGTASATLAAYPGNDGNGRGYFGSNGNKYVSDTPASYGASFAVGDVIGVRLNGGTLTFYKNGTSQGSAFTGLTGTWYPMWGPGTSGSGTRTGTINTGQSSFTGGLPSGSTAWG